MPKSLWIACLGLIASPALLPGQAFVEYGLATAASGVAGAPGQRASRPIAGVFSSLSKTLDAARDGNANQPAPSIVAAQPRQAAPVAVQAIAAPPPQPAIVYEDPAGIRQNMDGAELLRRFGPPAIQITSGAGCESLTYEGRDQHIEVELRDGRVASVRSRTKARQSAVVLLQ